MEKLTTPEMDVIEPSDNQVDDTTTGTQSANADISSNSSESSSVIDDIWNVDDISSIDIDTLLNEQKKDDANVDASSDNKNELPPADNALADKNEESGLVIKKPFLKFKGKEIPIDSEEELINLAQKGFKLESEMSRIKPYKRIIDVIESNGITEEELVALTDFKKGNKEALSFFKSKYGIKDEPKKSSSFIDEMFEDKEEKKAESKTDYKPQVVPNDPVKEYFTEVAQSNPALSGKVVEIVNEIEPSFYRELYSPDVFPAFVEHVANGMFEKVYPYALKTKNANPTISWLVAYNKGVDIVTGKTQQVKQKETPAGVSIPKPASPASNSSKPSDDYARIWEDDEYYNSLRHNLR